MRTWLAAMDWMLVALVGGMAVIAYSLYRAHCDPDNKINLVDLVLENGRMSRTGVAFMVTLGFSVWMMVNLEVKGHMTEGYFTTFCAVWVTPIVARLVFQKPDQQSPPAKETP